MANDKWRVYQDSYPSRPGATPQHKIKPRGNREIASTTPKRVPLVPPPPPPAPSGGDVDPDSAGAVAARETS